MDGQPETDDEELVGADPDEVSTIETLPVGHGKLLPAKMAVVRHHLTDDERATLLIEYIKLGPKPQRGAVKALCDQFTVSRKYASTLKVQYDRSASTGSPPSFKRKPGSGCPSKLSPEKAKFWLQWAEKELYEFTYEAAGIFLGVHRTTISRYME